MISLDRRIEVFEEFGTVLSELNNGNREHKVSVELADDFDYLMDSSIHFNGWFTQDMIKNALNGIVQMLQPGQLLDWISPYKSEIDKNKKVGVILAGNIPAVGFHDFLSVLISGNRFCGKLSGKDQHLLPFFKRILVELENGFDELIEFTQDPFRDIEAIIATGSDNSARYFEHYFGKYPNIIRKNRTSVAILTGNETTEELKALGQDLFLYYGLGCRNVSKLFVPEGYDFKVFFEAMVDHGYIAENNKYYNNYEYNKTIYLLNNEKLLDNNFVIVKEEENFSSPVGVLYYSSYKEEKEVLKLIEDQDEKIQCVVGKGHIPFGKSQSPGLTDYADNVNSLAFLTSFG